MRTKRIIAVCIALVLVVGIVGGGYYYWWTGTPQYSLLQLKGAISRGDSTTALSYFNTDEIFNNLWAQVEAQASVDEAQATQSGGALGTLGAMIGQGLLESIKPEVEQKFVQSLDAGIMSAASSTAAATSSVASVLQSTPVISTSGATTTVSFASGISFEMTQESHSHWVVVAINGLTSASSLVPSTPATVGTTAAAAPSGPAPQTSQKFGAKTELVSLSGQDFKASITVSSPQLYQSINQYTQPQTGDEFVTVLVKYDNESGGPISYSDSGFSIVDAQSNRYQPDVLGRDPQLGTGAILNSGQSAQGYITFEVPVGVSLSGLGVHYESSAGGGVSFDFGS